MKLIAAEQATKQINKQTSAQQQTIGTKNGVIPGSDEKNMKKISKSERNE